MIKVVWLVLSLTTVDGLVIEKIPTESTTICLTAAKQWKERLNEGSWIARSAAVCVDGYLGKE
jgi:hypothetical protein